MSDRVFALTVFPLVMIWNAVVLGVTAYAVFWLDRSGWWFALALVLVASGSETAKSGRAR